MNRINLKIILVTSTVFILSVAGLTPSTTLAFSSKNVSITTLARQELESKIMTSLNKILNNNLKSNNLEKAKKDLVQHIDKYTNLYLRGVEIHIANLPQIATNDKQAIHDEIQLAVGELIKLKKEILMANNTAEIQHLIKTYVPKYRSYYSRVKDMTLERVYDVLDELINDRSQIINQKINSHIELLKSKGIDTTKADEYFQKSLYYNKAPKESLDILKKTKDLKQVQKLLSDIRSSMRSYIKYLKLSLQTIKSLSIK